MRTYQNPGAGLARALRLSGLVVSTLCIVSLAQAQERRYLFEVSVGAGRRVPRVTQGKDSWR